MVPRPHLLTVVLYLVVLRALSDSTYSVHAMTSHTLTPIVGTRREKKKKS